MTHSDNILKAQTKILCSQAFKSQLSLARHCEERCKVNIKPVDWMPCDIVSNKTQPKHINMAAGK